MTGKMDYVAFRRELHRHPALSGREEATAGRVARALEGLGPRRVVPVAGGRGVMAEYGGREAGPTVLLRADMDAVAVAEPTGACPWGSTVEGVAHKCGHDGHTTMLLRAAGLLAERPPARGRVLLLFQPAEETGQGAREVVEEGWLEREGVERCFALHNIPGLPLGTVACREGSFTCAVTGVEARLLGRTAHAAEPERGVCPAGAAMEVTREVLGWSRPAEEGEGYFLATLVEMRVGEEAYGVAAGEGVLRFTLRARTNRVLEEHVRRLVEAVAVACRRTPGLRWEWREVEPFPANENEARCAALVREAARREGARYEELARPFAWGEDFGWFTRRCPGAMFGLGAGEGCAPLHSPGYDFPDELIEPGGRLLYRVAMLATGNV